MVYQSKTQKRRAEAAAALKTQGVKKPTPAQVSKLSRSLGSEGSSENAILQRAAQIVPESIAITPYQFQGVMQTMREFASRPGVTPGDFENQIQLMLRGGGLSQSQVDQLRMLGTGGGGGAGGGISDTGSSPSATGSTTFATGNPQLDDFLNNTYLPLLESEFSGDPTKVFDNEVFSKISERIGKTFGPLFEKSKQQIEQDFNLQQQSLDLQRRQQLTQLGVAPEGLSSEIDVARRRLSEDVGVAKTREARNLQDATRESADAYAAAGRAFGGGRIRAERELGERSQERISDIERESKRREEDLARQEAEQMRSRGFLEEQLGPQGIATRGLALGKERSLGELTGERTLMEAEERRRLRDLGASVIQHPEFYPIKS